MFCFVIPILHMFLSVEMNNLNLSAVNSYILTSAHLHFANVLSNVGPRYLQTREFNYPPQAIWSQPIMYFLASICLHPHSWIIDEFVFVVKELRNMNSSSFFFSFCFSFARVHHCLWSGVTLCKFISWSCTQCLTHDQAVLDLVGSVWRLY